MKRMVTDTPLDHRDALLNFAFAGEDNNVKLRYADGCENVDLCEYIANNACCQGVDAAAVMEGACMNCDCRTAVLYIVAIQAAELRERLRYYEDMEEQGRLVVMPCKVGDTVCSKDGKVAEIEEFYVDKHGITAHVSFQCDYDCNECAFNSWHVEYSGERSCDGEYGTAIVSVDQIGKTVFLTREEAEAALKGGEG